MPPVAEKELIRRIRRLAGPQSGIGDDCAVLPAPHGHELLLTTDLCLEGIHFRRDWHPAAEVGHRCLLRGLSDIAAMGGEPIAAFLSLGLPARLPQRWVDGFLTGFLALGRQHGVPLAGGDTGGSKAGAGIVADVVVLGSAPRGKAVRRSGARPGDILYVTGSLGGGAARLRELGWSKRRAGRAQSLPQPRLEVGRELRERRLARAMIDLSDGLSTDLHHLCEESGVGAVVNRHLLPLSAGATLPDALHGGEDYELLFTAPARRPPPVLLAGVGVTEIGWITRGKRVLITDLRSRPRNLAAGGWEHFRSRR